VEKALVAAIRFDPEKTSGVYTKNGGEHFRSFVCDILEWRCVDFFRRKSEGYADSRYYAPNQVMLVDEFDTTSADDVEIEIERFLSSDRVSEWTAAAEAVGLPLPEFITVSLDRASAAIKRSSSAPRHPGPNGAS